MKNKASSVKVGVADNNLTRGGHILHEQKYNTGHGISAIPNKRRTNHAGTIVCGISAQSTGIRKGIDARLVQSHFFSISGLNSS